MTILPRSAVETTAPLPTLVPIKLPPAARPVSPPVGHALAKAVEEHWEVYRAQLRRCQRNFSEKAVHNLRVATRRLLAQLVLLSDVTPNPAVEKARRILKRRLTGLSDLRDAHVQRLFIEQKVAGFPELLLLRSWLKRRERRLLKSAIPEVKRWKAGKLERLISALVAGLTANGRGSRAQSWLSSALLRATAGAFAEAVRRRQGIDLADPRTIHQTRVAFKRFRYMVESLSPTLTGLGKRQLHTLACYQRKMGLIQDLEVLRAAVAGYVRGNDRREALLRPFCRYFQRRRARALRSFAASADHLLEFWPPAKLAAPDDSRSTRNAT